MRGNTFRITWNKYFESRPEHPSKGHINRTGEEQNKCTYY